MQERPIFLVDGQSYPLVGDFEYDPSSVERESKNGMDGVHGYTEKPVGGIIKGTLRDSGDFSVANLNAMTGVTVVCELAINGKTVTGTQMWTTRPGRPQKVRRSDDRG